MSAVSASLRRLRSACAVRGIALSVTSSYVPGASKRAGGVPAKRPHALGAAPEWVLLRYSGPSVPRWFSEVYWYRGPGGPLEQFIASELEAVRLSWPASRGGANSTHATRAAKQARLRAEQAKALGVGL